MSDIALPGTSRILEPRIHPVAEVSRSPVLMHPRHEELVVGIARVGEAVTPRRGFVVGVEEPNRPLRMRSRPGLFQDLFDLGVVATRLMQVVGDDENHFGLLRLAHAAGTTVGRR